MELTKFVNGQLSDLAGDILTSAGSMFFWGEVEVPECLREQLEENTVVE